MKRPVVIRIALIATVVCTLLLTVVGLLLRLDPPASTPPATKSAGPELTGGLIVTVDDAVVSVLSAKDFAATDPKDRPAPGNRYVIVRVRVENRRTVTIEQFQPSDFQLKTGNGSAADYAVLYTSVPDDMRPVAIAPGGTMEDNIVFEVPYTDDLALVMKPNSISAQVVEIPLVPAGSSEPEPVTLSTTRTVEPPVKVASRSGRVIPFKGFTLTVVSIDDLVAAGSFGPPPHGARLYGVRISVSNPGSEILVLDGTSFFWIRTEDGVEHEVLRMDNVPTGMMDEGLAYIAPHTTEEVTVPFEVPGSSKGSVFVIRPSDWSETQVEVPLTP